MNHSSTNLKNSICSRLRPTALKQTCWTRVLPFGFLLLAGCQSYRAKPLEPQALLGDWKLESETALSGIETSRVLSSESASAQMSSSPHSISQEKKFALGLQDAEKIAIISSPELRILRARLGLAQADLRYAQRWDDPELSFEMEKVNASGDPPWAQLLSFSVRLPISGRSAIKKEWLLAEREEQLEILRGAEWAVIQKGRRLWLEGMSLKRELDILAKSLADMDQFMEVGRSLLNTGSWTQVELGQLRLQWQKWKTEKMSVEGRFQRHRGELLQWLGLEPESKIEFSLPALSGDEVWKQRWQMTQREWKRDEALITPIWLNDPKLKTALKAYMSAEQQLRWEIRAQVPDLELGLGRGREDGASTVQWGVSFLPLPIWNANRAGIAAATTQREIKRAEVAMLMREWRFAVEQLKVQMEHGVAQLEYLESDWWPSALEQWQTIREWAQAGRLDVQPCLEALSTWKEVQLQKTSQLQAFQEGLQDWEALCGPPSSSAKNHEKQTLNER